MLFLRSAAAELPSAPVEVSVCADSLEVRSGGSCDAAALPAGVRLAPSSCRGLRRLRGDGLHLRVRLRGAPPAAGEGGAGRDGAGRGGAERLGAMAGLWGSGCGVSVLSYFIKLLYFSSVPCLVAENNGIVKC